MSTVRVPLPQRLILYAVPWEQYTRLLRTFSEQHLRLTYDRGTLEIMTYTHKHESWSAFLGYMVVTLTQELKLPLHLGGSTTLRRKRKQRGLEPDKCYWITHEAEMRGKERFNLRTDPPPDLAIEVDITRSCLNRMGIYAKLRVPEVWRYHAKGLDFFVLNAAGKYEAATCSTLFALPIAPADLMPFLHMRGQMDDNSVIAQFRDCIRARLAATQQP
jgi:Uma2 family endonuclease